MRLVIIFTLTLLFNGFCQSNPGTNIISGQEYNPGTRVTLPTTGVSFIVPRDWRGGMPADQAIFIMASQVKAGIGMAIMQSGMDQVSLKKFLTGPQDLGDNVILQPQGSPKVADSRITMEYTHTYYSGSAVGVIGTQGNSVVFFFAGPTPEKAYYQGLLKKLASSAKFSKPTNTGLIEEWQQLLGGMMLKKMDSYYSGDASGGYGAYSSEETLHICTNGSYSYTSSSSLGVDGGGGSSGYAGGSDGEQGKWKVVVMGNQVTLLLEANGGSQTHMSLAFDGERTFLNGDRAYRVKSDLCQ
jgi:hypothetical protein